MNSSLMLEKLDSEKINGSAHFSLTSFKSKVTPVHSQINLAKYQNQIVGDSFPATSHLNSNTILSSLIKSSPFGSLTHYQKAKEPIPRFGNPSKKEINLVDKYEVSELTLSKTPFEDSNKSFNAMFTPRRVEREALPVFQGSPDPPFERSIPFSEEIEFLVSNSLFKKQNQVPESTPAKNVNSRGTEQREQLVHQNRFVSENSRLTKDSPRLEIPSEDFFSDFSVKRGIKEADENTFSGLSTF